MANTVCIKQRSNTHDQTTRTIFQNDSSKKLCIPPSRYRELTDIVALNTPSYPRYS